MTGRGWRDGFGETSRGNKGLCYRSKEMDGVVGSGSLESETNVLRRHPILIDPEWGPRFLEWRPSRVSIPLTPTLLTLH